MVQRVEKKGFFSFLRSLVLFTCIIPVPYCVDIIIINSSSSSH